MHAYRRVGWPWLFSLAAVSFQVYVLAVLLSFVFLKDHVLPLPPVLRSIIFQASGLASNTSSFPKISS